jgi:Zn-dependent peptidase ImmA (M78 family)
MGDIYGKEDILDVISKAEAIVYKNNGKKSYIKDPSVDIDKILRSLGIEAIKNMPPNADSKIHAYVSKRVLYLDTTRTLRQQIFSKAHEAAHIIHGDIDIDEDSSNVAHGETQNPLNENEQYADFFAANLIVPLSRFELWEDKTDKEIAAAFKVEEECIQKRRKEYVESRKYLDRAE